ncbi:MAG: rane protein involved in the export of O-antigen and teichoic acid [Bacteroidetes bacterium]|nr:rane protein involved in the export of O-antigen and teichoic acid [Bacteroidota bacterium]
MGIIEKQATKNAIYSYLGAALGFITVMWLSHLLSTAENGVVRILISYTALMAQFANLGFVAVTIRFFPYFRNKDKGHHGFLFYAVIISLIGFLLCWIIFFFLKPYLISSNEAKSPLFVTYLFYLMPLTFFTVFFNIFDSYLRACYSSVAGSLTKEFLQRILILLVLCLYFFGLINFPAFMFLYILFTCLPTLMLLFYIVKQGEWHIRPVRGFMSKSLRKEMIKLSLYSILTGGAGAIVLNIDAVMVTQMLGEKKTGIYGIAFYFGAILLIPARSIYRITSSIVAEHFKVSRFGEIHKLYKQSCNSQLAIGMLLYIGIWSNIDNIMQLLPPEYGPGKNVILILGAGYLVEMATGINQVIISNSTYYKYDTYFVFILVGIIVLMNYIFIPIYGIIGSAIATAITVTIGNFMRYLLLYIKYQMQPYNMNTLKILFVGIVSLLPGLFIPYLHNLYLDIAVRSSIVGGIFILLTLKLEAAPELNQKIRKNLRRFSIEI